jgi:NADPH:quinone reductase-like Zn-dependent oxidoreductase
MQAASLNFVDIAVATGTFPAAFPLIPVADGAGEVVAVGAAVRNFKIGDKVIPHFMPRWRSGRIAPMHVSGMRGVSLPGSLAEFATVEAESLAVLPPHLDFVQGATIPIAGTTAWNALQAARIGKGSIVALLGTGGVSLWALQLARAVGATIILTSSSDEKLERGRELGAHHLINYRSKPDWDAEILRLTDGYGADLVLETIGGATFPKSINAAAFGGTVFTVGFITGSPSSVELLPIIVKALNVIGNNTGSVANFTEAVAAIATHKLVPTVSHTFGINETAAAYAELAAGGRHFGKIAIVH